MKHDYSAHILRRKVRALSDLDLVRVRYCYQIGSTFVACSFLEDSVVTSMLFCDRVTVASVLREDTPAWEQILNKHRHLQASTLGTLISLLAKHDITPADLGYLRWLKAKRDFFIHRFFHSGAWPGDLDEAQVDRACRTLGALEILFHRGAERMIPILGRAGLMKVETFQDGLLAMNPDLFEKLG